MGLFDEVLCNHEFFGVHKGETQQTKDLHWLGGFLDQYEITPSGRLEFLEYRTEDRSEPNAQGSARFAGMTTRVFTGGRRDLNYHGWFELSCFGRAKFTDGTMVEFVPEQDVANSAELLDAGSEAPRVDEERAQAQSDLDSEDPVRVISRSKLRIVINKFVGPEMPSWDELDAFVNAIAPALRSRLAWRLERSMGLDAHAIRQLLEDKSIGDVIAEEWSQFERRSE